MPAHMMWKPSVSLTALRSCSRNLSFCVYSGSSRWLKQVCAEGNRDSSVPLRETTKFKLPRPLIGTRSEPVQKKSDWRRPKGSDKNWKSKVAWSEAKKIDPGLTEEAMVRIRKSEEEIRREMERQALMIKVKGELDAARDANREPFPHADS